MTAFEVEKRQQRCIRLSGKERMSSLYSIAGNPTDRSSRRQATHFVAATAVFWTFCVGFQKPRASSCVIMHNSHKRKYASILPDSTDGTTRRILRLARLEISYPGAHKHYQSHTHPHGRPACIADDGGERPAAEPTPPWDASSSNASTTSNLWVPGRSIMGRSRNDASASLCIARVR
jgi:hypothetical protein